MSEPDGSAGLDEDDATEAEGGDRAPEEDDGNRGVAEEHGVGERQEDDTESAEDADGRLREIVAGSVDISDDVELDEVDLEDVDVESVLSARGEPDEAALAPADLEVDDDLIDRIAAADPEDLAHEIATLQLRSAALEGETAALQAEVDDLESRLARKQADFQNYKQRQQRRLEEEKQRATEDLVERLLDVRDNLERALDQDEDAEIRGGVESTLRQFDGELEREDVAVIDPEPGDETDPQHHEVLMRVESDQPADTVAEVHRPGYEMAGKVLRPAQVTVSEGPANDGSEDETDADTGEVGDAPDDEGSEEGEETEADAPDQVRADE